MSRLNNQSLSVSFGSLYVKTLDGSVTFNTSYSSLEAGYRLYGAKNVSYLLIPDSDGIGGYDAFVLTSGDYQSFYGDHSKNGLGGGEIDEVSLYKNAGVIDYGDDIYDITNFEKLENKIASIPVYGMKVSEFLGKLQSNGSYSNPENLLKELLKDQDLIGGYSYGSVQGPTVVDGFAGDDELLIDKPNQLVRGGQGNDLFDGLPFSTAIANGGTGDDVFDGSSSMSDRDQIKQHLWVGGSGTNRYSLPAGNTIVVIDQKIQNQSPDIVSFGSTLLAKPEQKTGYIVIETANPDVAQLDLQFVDQPLLDDSGKQLHSSGYFSILYNDVEQVRINPMAGGWDLEGFISEREKYEDNIRSSIAVASMDQLIVAGNYTEAVLSEIKQDFNLSNISNRNSVDLAGQTLFDKTNYISIADRYLEPEPDPTPESEVSLEPEATPDPELSPDPELTPNKDKDLDKNIKGKSKTNVFSELFDVINIFDDLVDLDDSLSGTFKITRKTNRKGIAKVRTKFIFKDDILQDFDIKKVSFKGKSSNSLFGDFGDAEQTGNPRTVKSGNKKFDYLYNGTDVDALSKDSSKKLIELSIVPGFVSDFESQKVKEKGSFRVNLDDSFIALATGKKEQFADNLILRADFEPAFDLLYPTFELLA